MKGFTIAKDMLRLFIALEIGPDIRLRLGEAQARLMQSGARVSWVAPDNVHLTLAFLGDVFPEQVDLLTGALDRVGESVAPFTFTVSGLGYFGPRRSPRVIWAGVTDGVEAVRALQARVDAAVREQGFALEERPFAAHLTIGRVRYGREAAELAARVDADATPEFGVAAAGGVLLMRSQLNPHGAAHTVVHAAPLKASNS